MKILFGVIFVSGIIFEILAIKQYNYSVFLLENGIKTQATVIEMIEVDSDDGYTYKPKFGYIDDKGIKRTFTSSISTNPPSYEVGDKEEIVYNPKNYSEVRVVTFTGLYLFSLVMSISGGVMLIMGIVFFWVMYKKNRNRVKHIGEYLK